MDHRFCPDGYEYPPLVGRSMREVLESLAAGECSVDEAEAALNGYVTDGVARFDAARDRRRGIPEAILAEGKTPDEVAAVTETALETTEHALVTRADSATADVVQKQVAESMPGATIEHDERSGTIVVHAATYDPPSIDASVGVISAGTADTGPATEAAIVASELGPTVDRIEDVGVANLTRITDRLDELRDLDVLVVAAGREGALPTVVAGLVSAPVIGLPVSCGYGHAGDGEAALAGLLQSCTVLSVVNIDAGYVAGAQAGLIAQSIAGS